MLRAAMLAYLLAIGLSAADDPFSGTWKLNLAKSKLPPPLVQSQIVRIEANAESIRMTEDIVDAEGKPVHITLEARFDGKFYPVKGSHLADAVSFRRVDRRTLESKVQKDGKVVETEKVVLSRDGKSMTATFTGTDSKGAKITGVAVVDRQ